MFAMASSETMVSKISSSDSIPRAFIRAMSGMDPEATGTETMTMPSFFFSTRVRARYPSFWENTLATSTAAPYFSLYSTMTLLGARSSSVIRTLSVPPMMKYPPGSLGSSFCLTSSSMYSASVRVRSRCFSMTSLLRLHPLDLTIMGRSPTWTHLSPSGISFSTPSS